MRHIEVGGCVLRGPAHNQTFLKGDFALRSSLHRWFLYLPIGRGVLRKDKDLRQWPTEQAITDHIERDLWCA